MTLGHSRVSIALLGLLALCAHLCWGATVTKQGGGLPFNLVNTEVAAWGIDAVDSAVAAEVLSEVSIAGSDTEAMVVFQAREGGSRYIKYAYFDGVQWSTESVLNPAHRRGVDPTVAYDSLLGLFVTCVEPPGGRAEARTYDPRTGSWSTPIVVLGPSTGGLSLEFDKPTVMRGRSFAGVAEMYFFAFELNTGVRYSRAVVSGTYPLGAMSDPMALAVDTGGGSITSSFCVQPSVASTIVDSPVMVAITHPSGVWQFLRGVDQPDVGPRPGGVNFSFLEAGPSIKLELVPHQRGTISNFNPLVPGPFPMNQRIPYILSDPTDQNRLFVVFYDAHAGSADMDVYCATLERDVLSGFWSVSDRVRVNDDIVLFGGDDADQFMCAATIDYAGRIHVIYYDDRRFTQLDSWQEPSFDVYYAYSTDSGATFGNVRLPPPPSLPADTPMLDHSLDGGGDPPRLVGDRAPSDYPGIYAFGDRVWLAWVGTNPQDFSGGAAPGSPATDKTVVYVTKAQWY